MRISKTHVAAFALACLTASPSYASPGNWSRLPQVPHSGEDITPSRHRVLVGGLLLGRDKIEFEQTRWSDLQHVLGPLKMRRQGDASETEDWTCFTVGTGKGRFQVWLHGGELQGGEFIDGVTAQAGSPWPVRECPVVSPRQRAAALDNGIWVGTTKSEILKRLGQPTAVHGATLIYDFDVAVRDPKLGEGSVGGRLIFEIHADRVGRLLATKDTSY